MRIYLDKYCLVRIRNAKVVSSILIRPTEFQATLKFDKKTPLSRASRGFLVASVARDFPWTTRLNEVQSFYRAEFVGCRADIGMQGAADRGGHQPITRRQ
jgi:hypothetical protein